MTFPTKLCKFCNKKPVKKEETFCSQICLEIYENNEEIRKGYDMKEKEKLENNEELLDQMLEDDTTTEKIGNTAITKPNQFALSELNDETQIVQEFHGEIIKDYFYEMTVNGKRKLVVSYAGIKALVVQRGNMTILTHELTQDDRFYYATVMIRDNQRNLDGLGIAECEINKPFARRIALSKALRNAYRSIIDEAQIVRMVEKWKNIK